VLLTSRGAPSLTQKWLPEHVRSWSRKCRWIDPGEELVAAAVDGAGVLTRLFVAFPALWKPSRYRTIRLRLAWDDEAVPAVDVPVGAFFGVHGGRYRPYDSRLFSLVSGGMTCHAPMPFASGFRLSFVEEGEAPVPLFFFGVGYSEVEAGAVGPLRFHASYREEARLAPGVPFPFLNVEGRGYYVGLRLETHNQDPFWRAAPSEWLLPRGLGLGQLEGEEEIFVDGEPTSRLRGTGHEEYFNAGWYFRNGRFTAQDSGCLHRSYVTGTTASYRWHWRDPIPFARHILGRMHHGVGDAIPARYAATAYWYQGGGAVRTPPHPGTTQLGT